MEENHMGWQLVRGVRQDIINLFKQFAGCKSVRYEDFCKIWKQMNFLSIFCYRNNYIERLELVEEIFMIVKEYLLPIYEFNSRVAALYTLYAFYFKQPLREPVKIRMIMSEWLELHSFIETCKKEKHFDIVFIYLKMLMGRAFQFTATQRTAGLELGYRKYFKKRVAFLPQNYHVNLLYRPILDDKLVSSLVQLEELYCKKKVELLGKKNLEFIDTKFSVCLQNDLKEYAFANQSVPEQLKTKKNNKDDAKEGASVGPRSSGRLEEKGLEKEMRKKRKIKGKHLLAKKKAELYIRQLKGNQEKQEEISADFSLPDLE